MFAAVVYEFGRPPHYASFPDPSPEAGEVLIHISAAALNPSTRLLASGKHYGSPQHLPSVCGVEGVGRLPNGSRVFFGVRRPPNGSMAEMTAVPQAFCWLLPEGIDDSTAAALPNPGLSSWLPLVSTAHLAEGETVLVLGATGVAGQLAVQIAKRLGAGRVIAAGRDRGGLQRALALGADAVISLGGEDAQVIDEFADQAAKTGFDIVLDYVWARPTELLLSALSRRGLPSHSGVRLVQIGDSAGPVISLSAMSLRNAGLRIIGSGSMPDMDVLAKAFAEMVSLAAAGGLQVDVDPIPLRDIERIWSQSNRRRIVLIP